MEPTSCRLSRRQSGVGRQALGGICVTTVGRRGSQKELAHRAGLDRTYISGIERGIRNPTVLVLQDLAQVLGIERVGLSMPVRRRSPS
ncbi:MAG: helix-turn-helix transcriptional regulator [Acetobacteraceae bacterium]|nr:helix-turn-helix transcriptional regulator [Acetobacteraceae bacterium]